MNATPEEILSVQADYNERDIKSGLRKAALAYHPDKHIIDDDLLEQITRRRMQEVNEAYEYLRSILESKKA